MKSACPARPTPLSPLPLTLLAADSTKRFVRDLFDEAFGLNSGPAVVVADAKTGMAVEQKKSGNPRPPPPPPPPRAPTS